MTSARLPFCLSVDRGSSGSFEMVEVSANGDGQGKIPQELYSAITTLITCNSEEVWHLCQALEEIIRNKTEEVSIDSGGPSLLLYTVKRLLRGLASTSDITRSNFASALLYIFVVLGPPSPSKMLALMDAQLPLSALASVRRSERTALLKGRLIAWDILLEISKDDPAILAVQFNDAYQEILHLFVKHRGIERPAFYILSKLHSQLLLNAADRIDRLNEPSIQNRTLMLLHNMVNAEEESAIWRLSMEESSGEGSLQSLYVYSLAFLQSLMRTSNPKAFASAWRTICRMVEKSEKKWLPFMKGLLIDLFSSNLMDESFLKILLKTPPFIRILARKSTDFVCRSC